jgi:hypothetical protein
VSAPRRIFGLSCAVLAGFLGACGGEESKSSAPPGSPDNPLVAKAESSTTGGRLNESSVEPKKSSGQPQPGYDQLVDKQSEKPRSSFTPCNLVTKAQASKIVGKPIRDPLEAPQGPTCIYRPQTGKSLITVAVQTVEFGKLKPHLGQPRQFKVANRTAYCGQHGQPMLYVPLSGGRLLSIAGPCPVARQFAASAVPRLTG